MGALTLLRLLVAAVTPLSPDESYYWVWSRALAPGYFDHPPMVALWIRAGTWLAGDTPLGIRLLGCLAALPGSWLVLDAARLLWGEAAGRRAALLANATLLFGIGSVTATPDTPLLLFWTGCAWALVRLLRSADPAWWHAVGVAAGLAFDSKYTAVLLGPSVLAWLALSPAARRLARPPIVAAPLWALALALPVLAWNAAHGWASFAKQFGRAADWAPARAAQFLGELVLGQVGFATPAVFLLFALGTAACVRRWREPGPLLLACLVLVPSAVFVQHALGDRVQANWPCVLYPAAAVAAGSLAGRGRLVRLAAASGFALTALVWLQGTTGLLPLPAAADVTLMRVGGWDGLAAQVAEAARRTGAGFVASDNYGHAAILARDLPPGLPVLGADGRWSLFRLPDGRGLVAGRAGLLLRSARRAGGPDPADWSRVEEIGELARTRGAFTAERYRLYRVVGRADGTEPLAVLPRPRG